MQPYQPRRVDLPDGVIVRYFVAGAGRRIGKTRDEVLETRYLYPNALNPVAELDASGNITTRYVYATWGNVPDYMIRDGATYRIGSKSVETQRGAKLQPPTFPSAPPPSSSTWLDPAPAGSREGCSGKNVGEPVGAKCKPVKPGDLPDDCSEDCAMDGQEAEDRCSSGGCPPEYEEPSGMCGGS